MTDIRQVLKQWYIALAKHKDILAQAILSIEESEKGLVVKEKSKSRDVWIIPVLSQEALQHVDGEIVIVTLNTRQNLDLIISSWQVLSGNELLILYVVNPYSLTEKYWALKPFVHERITERKALRKGLEALYSAVEPYTEE